MRSELTVSGNRRVLVVDDNRAIHDDFRKILGEPLPASSPLADAAADLFGDARSENTVRRFEMDSAYQGHEAFEMVRRAKKENRPYAMAFVDVRMPPGWDGIETVEEIWRADRDTQIVICTAHSHYSWDDALARLGRPERIFILKKPFDNIEVFQLATALTGKWCLLRQTHERIAALEEAVKCRAETWSADGGRDRGVASLAAGIAARIIPARELGDSLASQLQRMVAATKPLLAAHDSLMVAAEIGNCDPALLTYVRTARAAAPINALLEEARVTSRQLSGHLKDIVEMVRSAAGAASPDVAGAECATATTTEKNSP